MKRTLHSAFLATWQAKALALALIVLELLPSAAEDLAGWLPEGVPLWPLRWVGATIIVARVWLKAGKK